MGGRSRGLNYIVVARMTPWLKRQAAQVRQWTELDQDYAVGEFRLQLHGWEQQPNEQSNNRYDD